MKRTEYLDVNTLIDAIHLTNTSKLKEYEQVGLIAVQSLKALESLRVYCPKGKSSACPLKATVPK